MASGNLPSICICLKETGSERDRQRVVALSFFVFFTISFTMFYAFMELASFRVSAYPAIATWNEIHSLKRCTRATDTHTSKPTTEWNSVISIRVFVSDQIRNKVANTVVVASLLLPLTTARHCRRLIILGNGQSCIACISFRTRDDDPFKNYLYFSQNKSSGFGTLCYVQCTTLQTGTPVRCCFPIHV